jgi:ABC-type Na+ transport system ATPase subunit NatA
VIIVAAGRVQFSGTLDGLRRHTGRQDLEEAFVSVIEEPPA